MKLRSHLSPVDPDIALIIGALCVVRRERYTAYCHIHGFYINLYVQKLLPETIPWHFLTMLGLNNRNYPACISITGKIFSGGKCQDKICLFKNINAEKPQTFSNAHSLILDKGVDYSRGGASHLPLVSEQQGTARKGQCDFFSPNYILSFTTCSAHYQQL